MKRSIFSRLLTTNLSLFIGFISILTVVLTVLYSNQVYQSAKKDLQNIAVKTETLYFDSLKGKIAETKLKDYIDAMAYVSKSKIMILNMTKASLQDIRNLNFSDSDMENYLYEDLKDILNGNEVFRNSQYSETFNTRMIFYGRPMLLESNIEGCIILFTPISIVNQNLKLMLLIIGSIGFLSSLIVSMFIFLSTKRLTRSIESVSHSALMIANDQSVEDLSTTGYKELNALVDSFNYMKKELARIEADKKEFISIISHEIKTPLTVIAGYLEAIHDGVLEDNEIQDSLEIIYRETQRLTQLTKEIVTRTTLRDMEFYLNPSIFKLKPILTEIVALAKVNVNKEILFNVECDEMITIYADENKIRQILSNLISNSIKYSHASVTITILCRVTSDQLVLTLQDNGVGIKKNDLEKVFHKFYRVKNDASAEGSGLGLNIVKKLIELHHGTVTIESEYRKGTTVILTFPLSPH